MLWIFAVLGMISFVGALSDQILNANSKDSPGWDVVIFLLVLTVGSSVGIWQVSVHALPSQLQMVLIFNMNVFDC